jgi:hypothetical protein
MSELKALQQMPPIFEEDPGTIRKYMPTRFRDLPRSVQNVQDDLNREMLADLLYNIAAVGKGTLRTLLGNTPGETVTGPTSALVWPHPIRIWAAIYW